ncbi:hypothetical protein [Azospirillum argentinense]
MVLYDGTTAIGTATAGSGGQWTITPTGTLDAGGHTLTAKTSLNGGTSSASTALVVTIDLTGPTLVSATVRGTILTLTYSETLYSDIINKSAFTVTVNGVAVEISNASVNSSRILLTLAKEVIRYKTVTVDYTPPQTGSIQDASTNPAGGLTGQAVVNNTPGDPNFQPPSTNPLGLGNSGSKARPVVVDLDGDGDLDVLVGNANGDTLYYRNVGTPANPTFTLAGTNPFGLRNLGTSASPVFADIDGDGDLDALVGNADGDLIVSRQVPAPDAPAGLALDPASDLGVAGDRITGDATPTITGTALAGLTVVLYDGATALGTTTAGTDGLWTITPGTVLTDGAHSLTAKTRTSDGTSPASPMLVVTIDATAPVLSSAVVNGAILTLSYSEALDASSKPGASAFTVTADGATVGVTNVAINGSVITLTLEYAVLRTDTVTVDYTPPQAASARDIAGNGTATLTTQPVSNQTDINFNLLGTNPYGIVGINSSAAPVLVDLDGDGDLDIVTGGYFGELTFYRNEGTATAPSFTKVGTNPFGLGSVGNHSNPAFADLDGDGDLDVLIGAGNGSVVYYRNVGTSTAPSFTLAGTNPFGLSYGSNFTAPAFADLDGDGDLDVLIGAGNGSVVYYRNVGTSTAPSFTLAGTNPFGLSYGSNFTAPAFADLDGDGDLDLLIGYSGGLVHYRNVGTSTAPSFTLAGTNPFGLGSVGGNASPVFVDIDGDGDVDLLIGNASGETVAYRNVGTSTAPSFTLIGTNPFGLGSVTNFTQPAVADLDGDGKLDVMLGDGAGGMVVYLQGPPPPGAPSGLTLAADSDSGVAGDRLTNDTTPTITGSAVSGATVVLYRGATAIGTATATGGLWTITPTGTLAQGSHTLTATATRMGSTSQASTALTLTIDTTAPNAPAVTSAALTNSTAPTLAGTAEANSTVTVTVGGATYTTTAAPGTGAWSVNLATAIPASGTLGLNANGTNAVSVTARDAAGNVSSAGTQTLTIDTTAPNAPTVTSAVLSNSATPTLAGTAEAGSTVIVTIGGATYTTTATGGTWSIDLATATPVSGSLSLNANGANPVSATATDAAGNTSTAGSQTLTIDTTLPDAPTVTSAALSNSATPTIAGTAEAGSTVTVTVGGATYTTTATGGTWSIDLATATPVSGSLSLNANGANPVSATATDASGNVSAPGTRSLTVDTTPPIATVLFDDDSIDAIEQSSTAFTISGGEAGAAFAWTITSAGGGQVTGSGVMSGPTAQVTGLDLSGLGDGTLTLTLTDPAGNASVPFTATTEKLTATVEKPAPVAPPPVATVDGATVNGSVTTNGDGSRTTTVTIAASTGTRVEDTSTANPDLADVPVVREQVVDRQTGQVSTQTTLTVSVSTGVAVTATGAAERQTASQALTGLTGLIAAIEARTDEGTASRSGLTGGGSGFLSVLSTQAQLLVRAIDFSAPGVAAGEAVQTKVTGTTLGGTGIASTAPTAVVLNTTAVAGPVTIQLDNVEFAAVVGNATLVGGDGEQIVYGDDHEQYMHLGAGDDILHGGGGNDTITSAGGNDTLYGDDGDDVVHGGAGNDLIGGGTGNDRLFGGTGNDILFGEEGDDTLTGEEGNDTLSGGSGNDLLFGEDGDDLLSGDDGDDTISGGSGNDTALGGSGNDLIGLGAGNDLGVGGDGDDTLFGEEGDDTLFGGAGNDLLHGGSGNDLLFADGGADTLWGGAGADVFAFGRNSGGSVVMDFEVGVDRLAFYEAGIDLGAVIRSARVEGGNTTLDIGGGNRITIVGQTGNVAAWFG